MLTRKPRKGELLDYDNRKEFKCLGTWDRCNGDVITIQDTKTGQKDIIIWRFNDCLNSLLTIKGVYQWEV